MSRIKHHWSITYLVLPLLLAIIFIPDYSAKADAGPKSSMNFNFRFPNNNVSIIEGKLLICPDKDCKNFEIYEGYFDCTASSCFAYPQGPQKFVGYNYYKIIVTFTDGVRESNVFQKRDFNSHYEVTFEQSLLIVKEIFSLGSLFNPYYVIFFIASAILTIPVETGIAFIYFWIIKIKKSFLIRVVLANLVSLAIIWFIFPLFIKVETYLFFAEAFVAVFEAIFLFIAGRNFRFPIAHAFLLSLVMNIASFSLGWWLIAKVLV
jgi:hypothetical protein